MCIYPWLMFYYNILPIVYIKIHLLFLLFSKTSCIFAKNTNKTNLHPKHCERLFRLWEMWEVTFSLLLTRPYHEPSSAGLQSPTQPPVPAADSRIFLESTSALFCKLCQVFWGRRGVAQHVLWLSWSRAPGMPDSPGRGASGHLLLLQGLLLHSWARFRSLDSPNLKNYT